MRIRDWYIVFLLIVFFAFVLLGCAGNKSTTSPESSDTGQVIKEVYKTNKVAVLFVLGIAVGVFLLIQGNKIGLAIIVACSGGLYALASYQSFATHPYLPSVVAVVGLLSGVGWFAYREYIRRQATAKLVKYGEYVKGFVHSDKSFERKEYWTKYHAPKSKAVQKQIDKDIRRT